MIKNYIKIAWRNLWRNKGYSLLNIVGLATGLTCFAFIFLWANDELSYDRFNRNYERIFRLTTTTETGVSGSAGSGAPVAKALRDDYTEVEHTVRLRRREEIVLHDNQQVLQPGILLTDPSFFDVFSYELTRGAAKTALNDPYSIILTESSAKKYFGEADPIGRTLTVLMNDTTGSGAAYTITGVMPDPPRNAHFTFTMLASMRTVEIANPSVLTAEGWNDTSFYTYVLLKEGTDYRAFSDKIARLHEKYRGKTPGSGREYTYALQPLRDIYLRSDVRNEIAATGNITYVYVFFTIGIFILLLAGINYTNLAVAHSMGKAKEVGVRKVAGAAKTQLALQCLSESVLTAMVALAFSFLFSLLLQPVFRQITAKDLSLISYPLLLLVLPLVTLFLGLLSGSYPALVFSAFKPAAVLKGSFKSGSKGVLLRKIFVVTQFVVTVVLGTGIVIVYAQLSFMKHMDLGYDREALLYVKQNGNREVVNGFGPFKNELTASPLISGVTTSGGSLNSGFFETIDNTGNPLPINTSVLGVGNDYLEGYGIELLAGNNFTPGPDSAGTLQIIMNETAVKQSGWENPETAIGKPIRTGGQNGMVVGVTKDFLFNSLHNTVPPMAISPLNGYFSKIIVKVDIQKADEAVALIEQAWKEHFPGLLFDYGFADQQIEDQYRAEKRFSLIFLCFSVLSLLIACLGLYGLVSYTAWQKTKEIGVRKVFGATVNGIVMLLSKDYLVLVLLACLIAMPITWYIMHKWLEDFAYRIEIQWWMFAVAGLAAVLIALLTVSGQAIKAAVANPVDSLRNE